MLEEQSSKPEHIIRIGHLSVIVRGRASPDAELGWDRDWLLVTAVYEEPRARVCVEGAILRSAELLMLLKSLQTLNDTLAGEAELACLEPYLGVKFQARTGGHIDVTVQITPDQMSQSHTFHVAMDQTFLPPIIKACRDVVDRYPPTED